MRAFASPAVLLTSVDRHRFDCRYRSTTNINLPFRLHPIVNEVGKSKVEYAINLKANFDHKLSANGIVLRIPTPLNTVRVECKVVVGKAKYVPAENVIVWK